MSDEGLVRAFLLLSPERTETHEDLDGEDADAWEEFTRSGAWGAMQEFADVMEELPCREHQRLAEDLLDERRYVRRFPQLWQVAVRVQCSM